MRNTAEIQGERLPEVADMAGGSCVGTAGAADPETHGDRWGWANGEVQESLLSP